MQEWWENAAAPQQLSEDALGYLLGRGMTEERVRDIGVTLWDSSLVQTPAPDPAFCDLKQGMGPRGERMDGKLCFPLWCPRGRWIGVEARSWGGPKKMVQYLAPSAKWLPVFVGLTPTTMTKLWEGGNVWVAEGVFDMAAMEHVIPSTDLALATLRARVSDRHALFFRRFCRGWVNMVYDNDETGRKQTHGYVDAVTKKQRWGALQTLKRVDVKARDVPYRGGKDPGEIWEQRGTKGLREAFSGIL